MIRINRSFCLVCVLFILLICQYTLTAQDAGALCGMNHIGKRIQVSETDYQNTLNRSMVGPEVVEVFVHHVTCTGCSIPAGEADSLLARLNDARVDFRDHNICFMLVGSDIIYNSDLAEQVVETEWNELTPYLKSGVLNVFIHRILEQPGNIFGGGWAYNIPSTYLSVESTGLDAACCRHLLSHEIGHCLGLFHTFNWRWGQNGQIRENVARTGSCKNCETEGDLICDTPADPNQFAIIDPGVDTIYYNASDFTANCNYMGFVTDACNAPFNPDVQNIMSYFGNNCIDYYSVGQGIRSLSILNTTLPALKAPSTLLLNQNATWTTGEFFHTAKTNVTFSAPSLSYLQNAIVWTVSGDAINVLPGTTFSPTNGSVLLSVQEVCH